MYACGSDVATYLALCCHKMCTKGRDNGSFSGFSFTSDESPPESAKYAGLRFQITWIYMLFFKPPEVWDLPEFEFELPTTMRQYLCDIINCPGKTGDVVYDCLQKQWGRFGLSSEDCCSGVGDGGGENEGCNGVHALMENRNPSYVRRRCLLHLPWRVADQGLAAMPELHEATKAIAAYIHEGQTWQRLKALATKPVASGGLSLFAEHSPEYVNIFGRAPPNNHDDRPATTCDFLQWLHPRQETLAKLAVIDVHQRHLQSNHSRIAVTSLRNTIHCIQRRMTAVLLNKALFMFHWTEGKQHVALHTNLSDLFQRAAAIISDCRIDRYVLKQLCKTRPADADGIADAGETSWIALAVRMQTSISTGEQDEAMSLMQDFHTKVSLRMRTHLSLIAKNIDRSTWLAGRLLSKDPLVAKEAANVLLTRLVTLRSGLATPFEQSVLDDEQIMRDISTIANDYAPACIWRKRGRTAHLFRFLANRFTAAPDSVGECESIHAQWKWLEINRRGITFKLLNAMLRLRNYVTTFGSIPQFDDLSNHVTTLESYYAMLYQSIATDNLIAPPARRQHMFAERFNLRSADLELVRAIASDSDDDDATDVRSVDVAWGNYVRFLFAPHNVYCLTALNASMYFYVAENKSVAGRDAPKQGDALGRAISVIWLEKATDPGALEGELASATEEVFLPSSGDASLNVADLSLAELSLTLGHYPAGVMDLHTARDIELMHERQFLEHSVERFDAKRVSATSGYGWSFIVDTSSGVDIEHWCYNNRHMGDHTKMSLARQLQARDGLSDDARNKLCALSRAGLLAMLRAGPGVAPAAALAAYPPGPAPPAVPGRGRGGRGRGAKGDGRGRGGGRRGRGGGG